MIGFLDKNEKRDLDILFHLYSENRFWLAEELAKATKSSINGVFTSILTLNRLIQKNNIDCSILVQKHVGICLVTKSYAAIHYLEILYITETFSYQILDAIFQSSDISVEKLQKKLHLSRSSTYRKLNRIGQFLNESNLIFSKSKLTIVGNEIIIREFFYQFYFSIADNKLWPFHSVSKVNLETKVLQFDQAASLDRSFVGKSQLLYRMAIVSVRLQQNKYVEPLNSEIEFPPEYAQIIQGGKTILQTGVPFKYKESEFDYMVLLLVCYPSSSELSDSFPVNEVVDWNVKNESKPYILVRKILNSIMTSYPNLELKSYFSSKIFLFKLISITNLAQLFHVLNVEINVNDRWNKRYRSISNTSNLTPKFSGILWEIITSFNSEGNIVINLNQYFYYVYSIFSSFFDLQTFEDVILIKLVSDVGYLSEIDLKKKISDFSPHKVTINTSEDREDERILYDLVLSDITNIGEHYPFKKREYVWAYPPSKRDWVNLKQILNEIQLSKVDSVANI